jgi:hypothetical protein
MREYYSRNPEYRKRLKARGRKWIAANLEWVRFCRNLTRYGLALDQYHARLEAQDFLCAICREEKVLVIDHNHQSDQVRGLLCRNCNTGFGNFREDPALLSAAISYSHAWSR